VSVKQRTALLKAQCFSSDLQQVIMDVRVLYRAPEQSVVQIYKPFAGDPSTASCAARAGGAERSHRAQYCEQIVRTAKS